MLRVTEFTAAHRQIICSLSRVPSAITCCNSDQETMAAKVQVYAYDLTHGMAAALSPMLLGHRIEGVWHTAVVIDGKEEIFFGYGINRARAGTTMFGKPHHIIDLGTTEVSKEMRDELLADIATRYRPEDYSLLWHNCNHFSNEFGQLLTGEGLPDYILNQAEVVFNTPWGESLMPMIMQMEGFTGRATAQGIAQQVMTSAQSTAAAAAAGPSSSAAAGTAGASSSAAAEQSKPSVVAQPGSKAAADAASAAANAAMERAAEVATAEAASSHQGGSESVEQGSLSSHPSSSHAASGDSSSAAAASAHAVEMVISAADEAAAAAQKAGEGVAALKLTADSRVQSGHDTAV